MTATSDVEVTSDAVGSLSFGAYLRGGGRGGGGLVERGLPLKQPNQ